MSEKYKMPDASVPCFNHLLSRYGPVTAAVYGKIWLYERMRHKECWASQERIAKELGLSRNTANRHISKLLKDNYIYCSGGKVGKKTLVYNTTELLAYEAEFKRQAMKDTEKPVRFEAKPAPILYELAPDYATKLTQNEPSAAPNRNTNKVVNKREEYKNNSSISHNGEIDKNPSGFLNTPIFDILSLYVSQEGKDR
jgi:DNA-binding Lrp family transcriptional regulator